MRGKTCDRRPLGIAKPEISAGHLFTCLCRPVGEDNRPKAGKRGFESRQRQPHFTSAAARHFQYCAATSSSFSVVAPKVSSASG